MAVLDQQVLPFVRLYVLQHQNVLFVGMAVLTVQLNVMVTEDGIITNLFQLMNFKKLKAALIDPPFLI